jgi:hypothetical protein
MPQMRLADRQCGLSGPIHEVGAASPVDVQVDQARRQKAAPQRNDSVDSRSPSPGPTNLQNGATLHHHFAVVHNDVGIDHSSVGEQRDRTTHERFLTDARKTAVALPDADGAGFGGLSDFSGLSVVTGFWGFAFLAFAFADSHNGTIPCVDAKTWAMVTPAKAFSVAA